MTRGSLNAVLAIPVFQRAALWATKKPRSDVTDNAWPWTGPSLGNNTFPPANRTGTFVNRTPNETLGGRDERVIQKFLGDLESRPQISRTGIVTSNVSLNSVTRQFVLYLHQQLTVKGKVKIEADNCVVSTGMDDCLGEHWIIVTR